MTLTHGLVAQPAAPVEARNQLGQQFPRVQDLRVTGRLNALRRSSTRASWRSWLRFSVLGQSAPRLGRAVGAC